MWRSFARNFQTFFFVWRISSTLSLVETWQNMVAATGFFAKAYVALYLLLAFGANAFVPVFTRNVHRVCSRRSKVRLFRNVPQ